MIPTGLLRVVRRRLRVVAMLYVVLAIGALAIPAALANPRNESRHPTSDFQGR